MTMMRFLVPAQISAVGQDEVDVVMATAGLARDGHILVPRGCRLDNYRRNPIVLWSHSADFPVGAAGNIAVAEAQIAARVRFAPLGISAKADEVRGLTKADIIRCVSVGFDPVEMKPLDPAKPRGGQLITVWELLELSFVSVPADVGAVVTARALQAATGSSGDGDADYRHRQAQLLELAGTDATNSLDSDYERRQRQLEVATLGAGHDADFERRRRDLAALTLLTASR